MESGLRMGSQPQRLHSLRQRETMADQPFHLHLSAQDELLDSSCKSTEAL